MMINFKIICECSKPFSSRESSAPGISVTLLNEDKGPEGGMLLKHTDSMLTLIESASRKDSVEGILDVTRFAFTDSLDTLFRITGVATLNLTTMRGKITHRVIADSTIVQAFEKGEEEALSLNYIEILKYLSKNNDETIIIPTIDLATNNARRLNITKAKLLEIVDSLRKDFVAKVNDNQKQKIKQSSTQIIEEIWGDGKGQYDVLKNISMPVVKALIEGSQGNLRLFFNVIKENSKTGQSTIEQKMFVLSSNEPLKGIPSADQLKQLLGVVVAIKDGINRQDKIEEVTRLLAIEHQSASELAGELLILATKEKDNETANHVKRMAGMSNELEELARTTKGQKPDASAQDWQDLDKLSKEQKAIAYALHDVGKVGIPDRILKFAGKLSDADMAVMRTHAGIIVTRILDGLTKMIKGKPEQELAVKAIRVVATQHHERYDGQGYSSGIAGKNIHLLARIASICDVYDALRSERPYKEAFDQARALKIMESGRGTQFDPVLLDLFINNIERFERIRAEYPDSKEDIAAHEAAASERFLGAFFQGSQLRKDIGPELSALKVLSLVELRVWFINKFKIDPSEEQFQWFIDQISIMR